LSSFWGRGEYELKKRATRIETFHLHIMSWQQQKLRLLRNFVQILWFFGKFLVSSISKLEDFGNGNFPVLIVRNVVEHQKCRTVAIW